MAFAKHGGHGRVAERVQYRPDIDGLRAVAVLLVLFYHFFPTTLRAGFIGVDIFFVISGFVITTGLRHELMQGSFSYAAFLARRVRRLLPALLLVLCACLAVGWLTLFAAEYAALGKHAAGAAGMVSNIISLAETGYFDASAHTKPLWHLWSLAIEAQFYLIWPLVLLALWRFPRALPYGVLVLLLVSFTANLALMSHRALDFYLPFTRFWELLLGTLVALSASKPNVHASWVACAGGALLLVSLLLITNANPYPGLLGLLPTIAATLLIAAGREAWPNRLLAMRGLVGIGKLSYPLYLWHWPLLSFATIIQGDPLPTLWRVALLALTFPLAGLTYRYVEQPLRLHGNPRLRVKALLVAMLLLGGFGFSAFHHGGYAERASIRDYVDNAAELVRPATSDEGCRAKMGAKAELLEYCRWHDAKGSRTVAIIGDSYAHAAFTGFAEMLAAKHTNTLLLGNSACPMLLGEKNNGVCHAQVEQALALITARRDITQVVITFHGSAYLLGDLQPQSKPTLSAAQLQHGVQQTIDHLHAADKRVYYIVENPVTGVQAVDCIPRPYRRQTQACGLPRAQVEAREQPYRQLLAQLRGVTVMDSIDVFCPDNSCSMLRSGVLLYADDGHLSPSGSRLQAQEFVEQYLKP
jgi:peptidoglycan/LPS O-acetylase OafA/YrhL